MIPKLLSQDHLPICFRFYDPIMKILKVTMSNHRKEYFLNMKSLTQEYYQDDVVAKLKK